MLQHFLGVSVRDRTCIDTLVLSRLTDYSRIGGHSLDAWGDRFQKPKSKFEDFSKWSQELEDRCVSDTEINLLVYNRFIPHLLSQRWQSAIETEHKTQWLCEDLKDNGFYFDTPSCITLRDTLYNTISTLRDNFSKDFPPLVKSIREITPSVTSKGTLKVKDFQWLKEANKELDLSPYSALCPFTLIEYVPFNPGSPAQIVERLNAAGWKPVNKTKTHLEASKNKKDERLERFKTYGWKVDEENLSTLPPEAPESAKGLAKFLLLKSRLEDLNEWLAVVDDTGTIHGTFNGLGSWTHRCSHNNPNMANIPAIYNRKGLPQPYGPEMRAMWLARPNHRLVGVDADGIQLRVFAHYVNSPELIKTIVAGRKEDKTDIHSLNQKIMGTVCRSRESAKTLIYALFLGAGIRKVQEILQCTLEEAQTAVQRIFDYYPGWRALKEERFPEDVKRGYFIGLDGRLVKFPGAHYLLAGYLQNGEAIIMKSAAIQTNDILQREKVEYYYTNFVHDEEQYSVLYKDKLPEYVSEVAMQAIVDQGVRYEMNCPLAANAKFGFNWKDTH